MTRFPNANGSYETTEHVADFTVDASGYADDEPTYDAAGNLTYDGTYAYTYDAWNRLATVTKAYRDPSSGNVTLGSTIATHEYDGLHRRIVRSVDNSADLDETYHDYYDGQSVVEIRNGSDLVLKQHVWGVTYIDELVQIAVNGDPVDDPEFDPADADHDPSYYYAIHNANYNVQLVVDDTGVAVERYEYAPYGERTVYTSPGSNDPDCHAPTLLPQRVKVAGADQPYGICDVGFQGKQHCDVVGLIFQGVRPLHPRLGRFINRDWLHYPDGLNSYAANFVMWDMVDPTGLQPSKYPTNRPVRTEPPGVGERFFVGALRGFLELPFAGVDCFLGAMAAAGAEGASDAPPASYLGHVVAEAKANGHSVPSALKDAIATAPFYAGKQLEVRK